MDVNWMLCPQFQCPAESHCWWWCHTLFRWRTLQMWRRWLRTWTPRLPGSSPHSRGSTLPTWRHWRSECDTHTKKEIGSCSSYIVSFPGLQSSFCCLCYNAWEINLMFLVHVCRLEGVEVRLQETAEAFEQTRLLAKKTKAEFEMVKKQRCVYIHYFLVFARRVCIHVELPTDDTSTSLKHN